MALKFILLSCIIASVNAACPTIVSRQEWSANRAIAVTALKRPVSFVIIHHTADSNTCTTKSSCISAVQSIQKFHQINRKWTDIGYSFVIGGDGSVYEGRGWSSVGSHAPNYNSRSYGISFIGDYTNKEPSQSMINAAHQLISCGVEKGYITKNYKLFGHRQVTSTECPGNKLNALLKNWPNYSLN